MDSKSDSEGQFNLTVSFDIGTDVDMAQVMTKNRVAVAEPLLPQEVMRQGVKVDKQSTAMVEVVSLRSPGGTYDELYISNYIATRIKDQLAARGGCGHGDRFRGQGLQHAHLAGSAAAEGPGDHRRRGDGRGAGAERVGGRRQDRRAAESGRPALPVQHHHQGAPDHGRGVRQHRDQDRRERQHSLPARRGPGRAGFQGLQLVRRAQRQPGHRHGHLPAARLQRAGRGPGRGGHHGRAGRGFPGRSRVRDPLRRHRLHHRLDRRGDRNPDRGHHPGDLRGVGLPAGLAHDPDPGHHDSRVADRHLRRAAGPGHVHQQPDPVRLDPGDRHRGGRRHPGHREHGAPDDGEGVGLAARHHRGHGRGHRPGDRLDRRAAGRVRADPDDARPDGAALPPVRHHHLHRHDLFLDQRPDARARRSAASCSSRSIRTRRSGSSSASSTSIFEKSTDGYKGVVGGLLRKSGLVDGAVRGPDGR